MLLSHSRPSLKEETKPESILSSPTELNPKSTNTNLVWEYLKTGPHWVPAAKLGGLKAADDVLQGGSHHKVLLLQAQLLPLEELRNRTAPSPTQTLRPLQALSGPPGTQERVSDRGLGAPSPRDHRDVVWIKGEPLGAGC